MRWCCSHAQCQWLMIDGDKRLLHLQHSVQNTNLRQSVTALFFGSTSTQHSTTTLTLARPVPLSTGASTDLAALDGKGQTGTDTLGVPSLLLGRQRSRGTLLRAC